MSARINEELAPTYEALKADRDAQQKRADALAVENAAMRGVIDAAIGVANNSSGIAGWHLNGEIAGWDEILPDLNIETPATSAALAAIEARAKSEAFEEIIEFIDRHSGISEMKTQWDLSSSIVAHIDELREAK